MIMVREPGDPAPNTVEYRHGLTPPMKDARKRRFRREPDLNVIFICYYQSIKMVSLILVIMMSQEKIKNGGNFWLSKIESSD